MELFKKIILIVIVLIGVGAVIGGIIYAVNVSKITNASLRIIEKAEKNLDDLNKNHPST